MQMNAMPCAPRKMENPEKYVDTFKRNGKNKQLRKCVYF